MRKLFEEYGDLIIAIVSGLLIISLFIGTYLNKVISTTNNLISDNAKEEVISNNEPITIDMNSIEIKNSIAYLNKDFDYKERVKALNSKGEDISNFIYLTEDIDTSVVGEKEVTYLLSYNGERVKTKAKVIVVDELEEINAQLD